MGKQLLKGKKGLILGALNEQSIAWQVALKCKEEGAKLVLSNAPLAVRFGEIKELGKFIKAPVIGADVAKKEDLDQLVEATMKYFKGPFDFILHSVAMSVNIRKKHDYTELHYDYLAKTLDVSAISFHKLLQSCFERDALNEWGSVVGMTFIASQRIFPYYSEMADAKSLIEGIARNFGLHYGEAKNVRVNTISQSPVKTTAGGGIEGFDEFWDYSDKMSPIGNAPVEALAEYCTTLFSDYTRYVTMQNLYHDGGFSSTGMTKKMIQSAQDALNNS